MLLFTYRLKCSKAISEQDGIGWMDLWTHLYYDWAPLCGANNLWAEETVWAITTVDLLGSIKGKPSFKQQALSRFWHLGQRPFGKFLKINPCFFVPTWFYFHRIAVENLAPPCIAGLDQWPTAQELTGRPFCASGAFSPIFLDNSPWLLLLHRPSKVIWNSRAGLEDKLLSIERFHLTATGTAFQRSQFEP